MAEVFRAVMPGAEGFRRTLVVKRIHPQFSGAASFVDMFVQEAQICSLLNHPNIVAVYDFGQIEGSHFLAMEYLRGRNLQAVMRKLRERHETCPVPVATYIAREVALGLAYAHDLGGPDGKPLNIVHRDVSPSNIMCLTAGGVKLVDFGIAKALGERGEDPQEAASFKGKLSYTAPERLRQDPLDRRSDLFSLGIVLWEMLTGRRLFRGSDEVETMKNVIGAEVPPPSRLRPEVPAALDAIVLRALARDPAERYQTAQEMADHLEEVLAESKYHSKMLPSLLRELFGNSLKTGQMPLESLEQELAAMGGDIGFRPTSRETTVKGEISTSVKPSHGKRTRWGASLAAGAAALAIVAAVVVGRGGDRPPAQTSSFPARHAALPSPASPAAPPSVAAPRATVPSAASPAPASPALVLPLGSAPHEPGRAGSAVRGPVATGKVPARKNDGAAELTGHTPVTKKPTRARIRVERDRITRGLSIDPFADAAAAGAEPH
jgi:serine/threonine-protein kinase